MYLKQHTISEEVYLSGVGLHTGESVDVRILPSEENTGFTFVRVDLPDAPSIKAILDNVVDSQRSTTISENGARLQTVEHLLAALSGYQIDNAIIEVSGNELPALDGSSKPYMDAFDVVGVAKQNANREFYVIDEPIYYHDPNHITELTALPYDDFRVTVIIDYPAEIVGSQHATMGKIEDFQREIAPCRTFCLWNELEALVKSGLIKGGSPDNALVFVNEAVPQEELDAMAKLMNLNSIKSVDRGVLNSAPVRFPNEPARHKLLDIVGDLALIGAPLKSQIVAVRPGHAPNINFGKKILEAIRQKQIIKKYQKKEQKGVVFDVNAIADILPHRYPFLLVDKITSFSKTSIEGIKNVTLNESFFQGHFPGNPIMPGVLILEAMAQVGGILLLNLIDDPKNYWVYFLAIDGARFKKPITPGDQVVFRLELVNIRSGICRMNGKAFVDEQLVCQAEIVSSYVRKK